ncbi:MAG TPA: HIT domain-containing protein [Candidatus Acidoferrales bacterium]|nr:HIT domain-containing protein [Candidatus Acidoferrales bacterium]
MDYIWSPWRYRYVADASKDDRCVFCRALEANDDRQTLIVHRAEKNFVILNRYPYTSGHVMIVPYAHSADLVATPPEVLAEMMVLAQRVQKALADTYCPEGYNLGMNLGRAAGAGITGHLHLHVLPRWSGDSSFMTVIGETRTEPEELSTTYERLRKALS